MLEGVAEPGELYALQLGVWSPHAPLVVSAETLSWTDLTATAAPGRVSNQSADGEAPLPAIAAATIRCYNLGGNDYQGVAFTQPYTVAAGRAGA